MDEKELFLGFWEREGRITRKVLARIPEDRSDYKPEPRSRSAREIAWLIAVEPRVLVDGLERGRLEWGEFPAPATMAEVLEKYDSDQEDVLRRLRALPPSSLEQKIRFMYGDYQIAEARAVQFCWEFLFDTIHHRGQLSTYLRPMGSTVPSIYGPSADEQG